MPHDMLTREIFGNVDPMSKGLFYLLALAACACFVHGVYRRMRLWKVGRAAPVKPHWPAVFVRLLCNVLLQRRLTRSRPTASCAHLLLFSGFAVLLLGTILIAVEHFASAVLGRPATDPLFHKGVYYAVYEVTLDTFGLALLIGCCWFLHRRRQGGTSMAHVASDWFVLGALLTLGASGYLVEGLRILWEQTAQPGFSYVGLSAAWFLQLLGADPQSASAMHLGLWWFHAVVALALIAVFPHTRLLHALAGAMNLVMGSKTPGELVPVSIEEVEETGIVGAGRIHHFNWRQLLQLDACVSCGRCQDACPAHQGGKPLSPRDVIGDLRSHLDAAGPRRMYRRATSAPERNRPSLPSLHGAVIDDETVWSCTTCYACVDLCPLGVDPLDFVIQMRRSLIAESRLRGSAATALQRTQRSGNPWGLPAQERFDWAQGLDVPVAQDAGEFDVLYWVGCAAAYDRRVRKVARAVVTLLRAAKVNFAVLGAEERCTGESARRMGEEFLFQELAQSNLEILNRRGVSKILTHCPHCLNSFRKDYPQFGDRFEVVHHSEYLAELLAAGRIPLREDLVESAGTLTLHDPCYLARVSGITQAPRDVLQQAAGLGSPSRNRKLIEMPRRGRNTACCGAGGGRMWFDDTPDQRIGRERVDEALHTSAGTVAVACPFCLIMLGDGVAARDSNTPVKDIAEILVEALDEQRVEAPSGDAP